MDKKEKIFNDILKDYGDKIYRLCCYYVKNEEDRKDLVQYIYVRIWSGLDSFQHKSSISTWIFRISLNSCIDFLRKEKKRRHVIVSMDKVEQAVADGSKNIEKNLIDSERIRLLYACMDRLSLTDKTIMSLYLEDVSYREMADIVGISEKNVSVKLVRIKKKLNAFIKDLL
jgi:RNA polymerase sigma-70 factor (ECF subfamily)